MLSFQTLQLLFLAFSFSSNAIGAGIAYRISKMPEVPTGIYTYWTIFFIGRFATFAASVFYLVHLDMSRTIFGSTITVSSWFYSAALSIVSLIAITKTYKSLRNKFPWTN